MHTLMDPAPAKLLAPGERRARPQTFSKFYADASALAGGACPIESGVILALADNECEHGSLPTDRRIDCACWIDLELAGPAPKRAAPKPKIRLAPQRPALTDQEADQMLSTPSIPEFATPAPTEGVKHGPSRRYGRPVGSGKPKVAAAAQTKRTRTVKRAKSAPPRKPAITDTEAEAFLPRLARELDAREAELLAELEKVRNARKAL